MGTDHFGPWEYKGYTIELFFGFDGPAEYVVTKDGGDDIASFATKADAKDCIDDMIADAAEFYISNVETIGDRS